MKKSTIKLIILTLFIICIGHCLFAQNADTIPQVSVSMVYNDVKTALVSMAEPLKEGAKYGFESLVKVNFWKGVGDLILTILVIISSVIGWSMAFKTIVKVNNENDSIFIKALVLCLLSIVATITSMVMLSSITETIMRLGSPEYFAIKEIMQMISGK